MSDNNNNSFGSFLKILLGIGIAVLIFMSYMLAEQRGWVNTNFASKILQGVEDGKAIREAEEQVAKAQEAKKTAQAESQKSVNVPAPEPKKEEPKSEEVAPADVASQQVDDSASDAGDNGSADDLDSDETSDESDDFGGDEAADESTPQEETPKAAPAKPKKLDFAEIAGRKSTWPKTVHVRVKGTRVPLLDKYGNAIGKIEIPIGTRLYVRKVTSTGVLEVKSAKTGQIFKLHHSRTTFRKIYTGKPISDGLVASRSSGAPAADSSSASEESSDESDDFGSDDDSSGSDDDDFFDDDF